MREQVLSITSCTKGTPRAEVETAGGFSRQGSEVHPTVMHISDTQSRPPE
jgi:hypothetical protein